MRAAVAAALTVASYQLVRAQPPPTCKGQPNLQPVWDAQTTLVNTTANGSKSIAAPQNYSNPLIVLHVYGTDYEMGFAYGQLLQQEMQYLVPQALLYMESQVNATLNWISEPYRDQIAAWGMDWALNFTLNATQPYTPPYWYDMIQGVSDGSGVPAHLVAQLAMMPEWIRAQCSIIGAFGPASNSSTGTGPLLQLRALDWDTEGPFQQYPVLVTWHPSVAAGGYNHTTLTWAGLLGAITGWSSSGLAISEKVWLGPSSGPGSWTGGWSPYGYPFNYLLQDILRWDLDSDAALSRIASANRTCSIWIGLGEGEVQGVQQTVPAPVQPRLSSLPVATGAAPASFRLVAYSNELVNVFNPRNFPAYPNHDLFPGLVFVNKHVQPSSDPCMNDVMHWLYGNLTGISMAQYVTALDQTGDMHIAIYDYGQGQLYISNASPSGWVPGVGKPSPGTSSGADVIPAYARPFLRFDVVSLWAQSL